MDSQGTRGTLEELMASVIEGRADPACVALVRALGAGTEAEAVLQGALIPAMDEVGQRYEAGEYFLPEMMVAAQAMKACMEILRPALARRMVRAAGRVVLGTVQGDLHDIGKTLVGMMLEGAGFEVVDLGVDVSPRRFVEAAREADADLLGMSALISTTMPTMGVVMDELRRAGLREQLKVLVGGAPVTPTFAAQIGADGYAPDAASASRRAREIVRRREGQ